MPIKSNERITLTETLFSGKFNRVPDVWGRVTAGDIVGFKITAVNKLEAIDEAMYKPNGRKVGEPTLEKIFQVLPYVEEHCAGCGSSGDPCKNTDGFGTPCEYCIACCDGHCAECGCGPSERHDDGGLYTCSVCMKAFHSYFACIWLMVCTTCGSKAYCKHCLKTEPGLADPFPKDPDDYIPEWECATCKVETVAES